MPAVFAHGFPETSAIWDSLRRNLGAESVALEMPGFASPRPAGFTATKDAYAQWLVEALRGIEDPIDLVGHDVGALLSLRVATAYDVPLRSFVVDVANIFHPEFEWPERVQKVQTPVVGEDLLRSMREADPGEPDSTAARLTGAGLPLNEATAMGEAHDETMSRSILDFYRSAIPNVAGDWWKDVKGPTRSQGLVLLLPDPPEEEEMSLEVARRLGAQTTPGRSQPLLDGRGPRGGKRSVTGFLVLTSRALLVADPAARSVIRRPTLSTDVNTESSSRRVAFVSWEISGNPGRSSVRSRTASCSRTSW